SSDAWAPPRGEAGGIGPTSLVLRISAPQSQNFSESARGSAPSLLHARFRAATVLTHTGAGRIRVVSPGRVFSRRGPMRFTASSISRRFLGRVARPLALGVGALLTAASLAACQPDTGPGSVVVSYVLGNSKPCDEVGVTDVQATLFRGDYENPDVLYSEMVSCDV